MIYLQWAAYWSKLASGQTIHSVHDVDGNRIAEYDYDAVAGTSTLIREYVWMAGEAVAVIEGGVTYYRPSTKAFRVNPESEGIPKAA
jgi:hypothetical protein